MHPVMALITLVALPPVLMACSHLYAMQAQDRKIRYVVVFDPRVKSARKVVDDHISRFHVVVEQVWDSSVKGYSGLIPIKHLQAIENDRRVQSVLRREVEEF